MEHRKITIAIADPQLLFRELLIKALNACEEFVVVYECTNGKELTDYLLSHPVPDIAILEANMPVQSGYETTAGLQKCCPHLPVLILSMNDLEHTCSRLVKAGVKGFAKKGESFAELKRTILSVVQTGYYFSYSVTRKLLNQQRKAESPDILFLNTPISEKEFDFLKLSCSDNTYAQIAAELKTSVRIIGMYREKLFDTLDVHSRQGMVMEAIRCGLIYMENGGGGSKYLLN